MPNIFDNIKSILAPELRDTLTKSYRADFCVGYFNLRGWQQVAEQIETWDGTDNNRCRLLVGMQQPPENLLRAYYPDGEEGEIDNRRASDIKRRLAQNFRQQLTIGIPTNADEKHLKQLQEQLRTGKVCVKLYLRHPLHAKLYLLFRDDNKSPVIGYLGSSNLTFSGLANQGELNVDVVDAHSEGDATHKLAKWFNDRWADKYCIDITKELIEILDESWVREKLPYHIYLKIAYHLSADARAGIAGYKVPPPFDKELFDFQQNAVLMAARHLDKRNGVLIGDVVGLGKTITAAALIKLFELRESYSTLIVCPRNLVSMWEGYVDRYELNARVMAITQVSKQLPKLQRRYRLVVVDESHNLRNREGRRYQSLHEYLHEIGSKVILLSATPYNKAYTDLSSQFRLFIPDDADLGIAPERYIRELGGLHEYSHKHHAPARSLGAFEFSEYADDWRELTRLFLVRRTRSFIKEYYAQYDSKKKRHYLTYPDGTPAYFPERQPRNVPFGFAPGDESDLYARLYSPEVVETLNTLSLPRYGLGQFEKKPRPAEVSAKDAALLDALSRAGKRLMGFCRTNLFKRLESSGHAFLLSLSRHVLRNYVFVHALQNDLPLPIGQQDAQFLDNWLEDQDFDDAPEGDDENGTDPAQVASWNLTEAQYRQRAESLYAQYAGKLSKRFRWLPAAYFKQTLKKTLLADAEALMTIIRLAHDWNPALDRKLNALETLCLKTHPKEKILLFTQFADTACYLEQQLVLRGLTGLAAVTGLDPNPTAFAQRFSPVSNRKPELKGAKEELRILLSTDVLSEGQNLQDAHVIVNYDLPWAIIRLIQRAGRVDRIGQQADSIQCYSFLPEDGIEQIIRLRSRLVQRLTENAEVVGTDEVFIDEQIAPELLRNLYSERSGVYDDEPDGEVDLSSYAYQIWQNATAADPKLATIIPNLAAVSHATQATHAPDGKWPGVLVYARTANDNDMLAWVDRKGELVSQSQFTILKAAACTADTPAVPRQESHHELVAQALQFVHETENAVGGQLGPKSSARYRTYHALSRHLDATRQAPDALKKAIEELYRLPLRDATRTGLNRMLKATASDEDVAQYVIALYEEGQLCVGGGNAEDDPTLPTHREPTILCSMGLT